MCVVRRGGDGHKQAGIGSFGAGAGGATVIRAMRPFTVCLALLLAGCTIGPKPEDPLEADTGVAHPDAGATTDAFDHADTQPADSMAPPSDTASGGIDSGADAKASDATDGATDATEAGDATSASDAAEAGADATGGG